MGGGTLLCDDRLLADTAAWENDIDHLRTMIQTMVPSRASSIGVEVYASANPRLIVIVNKGTTSRQADIAVDGVSTATAFQKHGSTVSYAPPASLGSLLVRSGQISLTLPGPSVTQLVIG
jgi:hypothetical protein